MLYPNYKNKPGWINQQKWLNSVQFPYGKLFTSQSVKTRPSLLEAETTNAFLMACCNKVRVGTSTTQPLDYTCWIYRTVYSRFVPPRNTNKSLVLSCTNTPVNCIPHHRFWYSFFFLLSDNSVQMFIFYQTRKLLKDHHWRFVKSQLYFYDAVFVLSVGLALFPHISHCSLWNTVT